ncbi:CocE/NonD family hydrolase [Streptomyces afghaniensis]|uniref:CocE/NonD family hydrolase n=1 Tax=Streptomyces afghaniensis TaxID=66865 RepID=UPI00378F8C10
MPAADLTQAHLDFFDRTVRGRTDATDQPPVRIFVMGIDEWRDEADWPLPDTEYTDYFLASSSGANSLSGDGTLGPANSSTPNSDTFVYDPSDPVPSVGGRLLRPPSLNAAGPVDQREVENRQDVLCYSSDVLDEPVEVTGHVTAVLHVASTAVDTDFTAKLVDVFPDGRAIYLTDGITRARYRRSLADPFLLAPGEIYEVSIDMSVTSNVFLPGHRIRLEVSSSNFPRYDRNTNTGDRLERATDWKTATNRVFHGPEHRSRLILPIIRRTAEAQ